MFAKRQKGSKHPCKHASKSASGNTEKPCLPTGKMAASTRASTQVEGRAGIQRSQVCQQATWEQAAVQARKWDREREHREARFGNRQNGGKHPCKHASGNVSRNTETAGLPMGKMGASTRASTQVGARAKLQRRHVCQQANWKQAPTSTHAATRAETKKPALPIGTIEQAPVQARN